MANVVLIVHLILALCLIGVVLLQRSEGGGLGMGGGGAVSARGAATALGKVTWVFAIAFIGTSLTLTVLAARNTTDSSVIDRLGIEAPEENDDGLLPPAENLLPPSGDGSPLSPPPVE